MFRGFAGGDLWPGRGVEVLRYDHRGIGESEGNFAETHFKDWSNDVVFLAERLAQMAPGLPLILHGLEIGAILAAQAFHKGLGGPAHLMGTPGERSSVLCEPACCAGWPWNNFPTLQASASLRLLSSGSWRREPPSKWPAYTWTSRFWLDSFATRMPDAVLENGSQQKTTMRPVKVFELGKESAPLVKAGYMAEEERKDFSSLFASNYEWLQNRLRAEVPA